ncbi:hypothetical protein [Sphaerotilus sp.]|uniref:hypothetical protein n=1 Tax=Sphaerotilus sp. TaxID=2093942 RepID=UPI00286DF740|nr:hypothetical protein [Sphaerotilus sp.]
MRIVCPHCQHRGFSALDKLTANPAWPARCKYCHRHSHPRLALTGSVFALTLGEFTSATAALVGDLPWWTVAVVTLLLAGATFLLLVRPSRTTNRTLTRRTRVKVLVLAGLIVVAAFGLLSVVHLGNSGQPVAAPAAE